MVWGERASERISARGIVVPQSDTAVFAASVTSVLLIHPTRVLYTLSNIPHHLIDARSTEIIGWRVIDAPGDNQIRAMIDSR